jgi:isopentenyldiphosphate isomerase
MPELLEVIDEAGSVVCLETRDRIHHEGLLHREAFVWVCNGHGEVLLQRRAKDKDTNPGLLDVSVGGHIEPGATPLDSALRELEEETGIRALRHDLRYLATVHFRARDTLTGKVNNAWKYFYAYRYHGPANELRLESGKATGLEFCPIIEMIRMPQSKRSEFTPFMFHPQQLRILKLVAELSIVSKQRESNRKKQENRVGHF